MGHVLAHKLKHATLQGTAWGGESGGWGVLRDFKTILVSKCWKCWIQGHSQLRLRGAGGEQGGEGKTGQQPVSQSTAGGQGLDGRSPSPWGGGLERATKVRRGKEGQGGAGRDREGLGCWGGSHREAPALALDRESKEVGGVPVPLPHQSSGDQLLPSRVTPWPLFPSSQQSPGGAES